jgi:hypothetical protein
MTRLQRELADKRDFDERLAEATSAWGYGDETSQAIEAVRRDEIRARGPVTIDMQDDGRFTLRQGGSVRRELALSQIDDILSGIRQ